MRDFIIETDSQTGRKFTRVPYIGVDLLRDPMYDKSTAFNPEERRQFGLLGYLPPHISTLEQQKSRVYENYLRKENDLERYNHLSSLQARNQTLFYALLADHLEEMMPIVYTPTVGLACQLYSHIFRRPYGITLTPDDVDEMELVLQNSPYQNIAVIVVTDNERILGLGDLGCGGMGIPIGKLSLYTACAGIHPARCLPVDLDVGTDNEALLNDPLYLGYRKPRLRGKDYDAFIEAFVRAVKRLFPQAILQWEDFKKTNAIRLHRRYRDEIRSFNDDIQGTGAVALSGLLAAMRIKDEKLCDQKFLFLGAGAAAHGIWAQIKVALKREGLSDAEAARRTLMVDSKGIVLDGRPGLDEYKHNFAAPDSVMAEFGFTRPDLPLETIVRKFQPTILLGLSGQKGAFTREVLEAMRATERPVIFPLSNPTSKSECTPQAICDVTQGQGIVATGSPFPPMIRGGKETPVSQGNNAFIFPGVGLGLIASEATTVPNEVFTAAAYALAKEVSQERLDLGAVYPPIGDIRRVSRVVAMAVAKEAVALSVAPQRSDEELSARLDAEIWDPVYINYRYDGPLPQTALSDHRLPFSKSKVR